MGRSLRFRGSSLRAGGPPGGDAAPWWDEIASNARAHGAMPYVVEGFQEISDAVRRGHAVLVRREAAEVAEGVTVFDSDTEGMGTISPMAAATASPPAIVAILRFDFASARFVLQDAGSASGAVQLTPRRLARYLESPSRSVGVALGA